MAATPDPRIAHMQEHVALPRQNGALVFAAPWEARAFGMAVALNDAGVYPWQRFSQGLAAETSKADSQEVPVSYYERWLTTLEQLTLAHGLVSCEELQQRMDEYAAGLHDAQALTHPQRAPVRVAALVAGVPLEFATI